MQIKIQSRILQSEWFFKRLVVFLLMVVLACLAGVACQTKKPEQQFLRIGLPEEPRSLNLWLGTDANSRKIISQIYQPLFIRHPDTLENYSLAGVGSTGL